MNHICFPIGYDPGTIRNPKVLASIIRLMARVARRKGRWKSRKYIIGLEIKSTQNRGQYKYCHEMGAHLHHLNRHLHRNWDGC